MRRKDDDYFLLQLEWSILFVIAIWWLSLEWRILMVTYRREEVVCRKCDISSKKKDVPKYHAVFCNTVLQKEN